MAETLDVAMHSMVLGLFLGPQLDPKIGQGSMSVLVLCWGAKVDTLMGASPRAKIWIHFFPWAIHFFLSEKVDLLLVRKPCVFWGFAIHFFGVGDQLFQVDDPLFQFFQVDDPLF